LRHRNRTQTDVTGVALVRVQGSLGG